MGKCAAYFFELGPTIRSDTVLGLGTQVEVLAPEALRLQIQGRLQAALNRYLA